MAVDFVAPTKPGGSVSKWVYLTATNRTARGVEAFILAKVEIVRRAPGRTNSEKQAATEELRALLP